jgi:hypothetical protein
VIDGCTASSVQDEKGSNQIDRKRGQHRSTARNYRTYFAKDLPAVLLYVAVAFLADA